MIDPVRVVMLVKSSDNLLKIYYNQATPFGNGTLTLVNCYDLNTSRLRKEPILPLASEVYRNFLNRSLIIPVIHVILNYLII